MVWYPEQWPVPEELRTTNLVLRMLSPDHTEQDYEALMESRERLRVWSNSPWPADDFTRDGNRDDLRMHEREFHVREAFAYDALNCDETRCEGCVYIRTLGAGLWHRRVDPESLDSELLTMNEHAAVVSFWVRESALTRNLDVELLDGLRAWFHQDWRFSSVFFMTNRVLVRDVELYEASGVTLAASAHEPSTRTLWDVFRVGEDV